MHLLTKQRIRRYTIAHSDAEGALSAWSRVVCTAKWQNLAEVRRTYPHADLIGGKTVFNIRGNHYRLITMMDYSRQTVYVRDFLTHAEYDKGHWKHP